MKGRVSRRRFTNTVTLVLPVVGSVAVECPECKQVTEHAVLGSGLTRRLRVLMCTLCNEVHT